MRQAERVTVPANSSRLESYAKAEACEAASAMENTFESPGFRYQPIHAKGATASLSAGTLHAPSWLNGTSHPAISLESVEASNEQAGGTVTSVRHER